MSYFVPILTNNCLIPIMSYNGDLSLPSPP